MTKASDKGAGRGKKKTVKEPNFEKDLERLDEIVSALEAGGLSLDDSLLIFEEGVQLSKRCGQTLSAAEKKIEVLTKNAEGELETEPFEDDKDEEGDDEEDEEDETKDGDGLLF